MFVLLIIICNEYFFYTKNNTRLYTQMVSSSRGRSKNRSPRRKSYYSKSKTRKGPQTSASVLYKRLGYGGAGTEKKGQDGKYWVLKPSTMRGVSTARWVPCGKTTKSSCSKKYSKNSWWKSRSKSRKSSKRKSKSSARKSSRKSRSSKRKSRSSSRKHSLPAHLRKSPVVKKLVSKLRSLTPVSRRDTVVDGCVEPTVASTVKCLRRAISQSSKLPRRKSGSKSPRRRKNTRRHSTSSGRKSSRKSRSN